MSEKSAKVATPAGFSSAASMGVGRTLGEGSLQPKRSGVRTQRNLRNATRKTANGYVPPSIPRNSANKSTN